MIFKSIDSRITMTIKGNVIFLALDSQTNRISNDLAVLFRPPTEAVRINTQKNNCVLQTLAKRTKLKYIRQSNWIE